ncbi:hypothetical protein ACVJBD_006672 [Rhizobium mongolense]
MILTVTTCHSPKQFENLAAASDQPQKPSSFATTLNFETEPRSRRPPAGRTSCSTGCRAAGRPVLANSCNWPCIDHLRTCPRWVPYLTVNAARASESFLVKKPEVSTHRCRVVHENPLDSLTRVKRAKSNRKQAIRHGRHVRLLHRDWQSDAVSRDSGGWVARHRSEPPGRLHCEPWLPPNGDPELPRG